MDRLYFVIAITSVQELLLHYLYRNQTQRSGDITGDKGTCLWQTVMKRIKIQVS